MGLWHVALLVVLWVIFYNYYWKRRKLPPGPTPHPLIGNLGLVLTETPRTGTELPLKWREKYGPVFTFWIGEIPIVNVTDYNAIIDSFVANADAYTGRFTIQKMDKFFRGGNYGIVFTEGELWREQRRFALTVFRNLGMGRNIFEQKVLDEVHSLIENLSSDCQMDSCDLPWRFEVCVGSIINSLLFGYRFEGEKLEEFHFFKKLLSDHMRTVVDPCIMLLVQEVDIMKYIFRGSYKFLKKNRGLFFGFFNKQIEEHEKNLDLNSLEEPTDYVEAYLREMNKNKEKGIENSFSDRQQLANMCLDLWFAGMETTANTLGFTALFLLRHPEVIQKMNEEFDSVIGSDRLITLKDKSNLKYLQAVINESQRMSNLLPHNLIHTTTQDVEICGYKLPKGTCIVPQIGCVLFDEKYFPDPYEFKPERFLDEEGNLKKIEQLVPFSVGKRQCLGESLAKMELFLIISNLYNQFKILPENPDKLPTLRRIPGVTWQAVPFKVVVQKRWNH